MFSKIESTGNVVLDAKGVAHMVHRIVVTDQGEEAIAFIEAAATLKIQVDNLFASVAANGRWNKSLAQIADDLKIPQVDVEQNFTAIRPDDWFTAIHGDLSVASSSKPETVLAEVPVSRAVGSSWRKHKNPPANFVAWVAHKDQATINYETLHYSSSWLFRGFLMTRAGEGKNRVELYRNQGQLNILTQLRIQDSAHPECMKLKRSLWGGLWIVEHKHKKALKRLDPLPNEISHGKYLLLWPEYSLPILEAYGIRKSKFPFFCLNAHRLRIKVFRALSKSFYRE